MGELRLHAISVYDVRDMFGADDGLAAQLRQIASETFAVPATEEQLKPSMIRKVGPMFRRDPLARVIPTDVPKPTDWETLIAGRYVEPSRLVPSWKVVDAWVDARDWGTATMTLTPPQTEAFDFALTKAGLHSSYSLGNLFANDVALPIRPAHGMRVGYAKNPHVLATADALRAVLDRVDPDWAGGARYLSSFLDAFVGWTDQARSADRALPDLYCAWWETSRAEMTITPPAGEPTTTGTRRRDPGAEFDPTAPMVTGRQGRATGRRDLDPTAPIVTGRQPRR
ncbi:hypothetical protein ACQB6R_02965 [Propionibacteriaceae bacterium G1746]|uniref:hypothetical protein n=1 Tax=Aestuariimicrobium sp. G57 TaxID=3418485 RepID=UPI003C2A3BE3